MDLHQENNAFLQISFKFLRKQRDSARRFGVAGFDRGGHTGGKSTLKSELEARWVYKRVDSFWLLA
ncbi:TPA: hypothetical protein DE059_05415 [Candidatus Peribacteria bacterium]|nr:hypothetical protein [Candidatus Peribacteria bacterium]